MIGRKIEIQKLKDLYKSPKSEFVAIYGRRRIGKTFLVDSVFKNKITFRHAGLSPNDTKEKRGALKLQLQHFYQSLVNQGMKKSKEPKNWLEAFFMLEELLEKKEKESKQEKIVVFLDELPWMDTPRSNFVTALEGFWNTWACHRENFMLIVCGSANSWIQNSLINNHGGLYGRLTYEMKLSPFTLSECEEFFINSGLAFSRYDIVQSYMIFGGVPYYLGLMEKDLSLAQNVDRLFFSRSAILRIEYDRLFDSVFEKPGLTKEIVKVISSRRDGYKSSEIAEKLKIKSGGELSTALNALIASDFVIRYTTFGRPKNERYYKLIDPFCLFYLKFVEAKDSLSNNFWMQRCETPSIVVWRALAFENVAFNHIEEIKQALGISGVKTEQSAYSVKTDDADSAQIDLIIERDDHIINLCEIKFYSDDFLVSKEYYRAMQRKENAIYPNISKKSAIRCTLITTYGLEKNAYSSIFSNVVTMEDFFTSIRYKS